MISHFTDRRYTNSLALLGICSALALAAAGCVADSQEAAQASVLKPTTKPVSATRLTGASATLITHGLACPSCAKGVQRELKELKGVRSFELDVVEDRIEIELDPAYPVTREQLKQSISWGGAILLDVRQP